MIPCCRAGSGRGIMKKTLNINELGGKVLKNKALPPFVLGENACILFNKVSRMNDKVDLMF